MLRQFFLLLGIWTLVSALPQNTISAGATGTEDVLDDITTTTSSAGNTTPMAVTSTTTEAPKSEVITIKDASDLKTKVSEAGDKLVVIFVMTTWCPLSVRADTNVAQVARATENIVVLKVVWNKMEDGDWKYGVDDVAAYPTFIFMRRGEKLLQYAGANPDKLRRRLAENLTPSD